MTCPGLGPISSGSCASFTVKTFARAEHKVVENIDYSSCTRNRDHLGLYIKTGSTHKQSMMSQNIIRTS